MFSRINNIDYLPPSNSVSAQKSISHSTEQIGLNRQKYDQFQLSDRLDGKEKRIQDLVGQISKEIRRRPTCNELSALQKQIKDGTYQPNSYEIAARMLLIKNVEA